MSEDSDLHVTDTRFELQQNGHTAFIDYRIRGGVLLLVHTEVPPELRGGGVGSELVRSTLDWAQDRGMKAAPRCAFVAAYVRRHPEYSELTTN
ncbi:MAG: GNAT family N-acetyltransferase [Terriglobales bacterium]